ncbi:SAM-dependent methyltransferase [Thermomonospora cellulosilytica]|uniref:O-methyltransferase involved in polyketide biosynthesis n=1 Tax=Thermomonospora cellulosilytica TaxID=1411118 RepID=A0A7W3N1S4_9ACTN|nr:SAM-dependent methyltransferase [Thermomonospora cellulosilytica]MBA9005922.1 O-methyltransferase involved in polyketide biosynthesis [Thermomonospora cellulosilytica]
MSYEEDEDLDGFDPVTPHPARLWDYWLGGKDHYEADRALGKRIAEVFPGVVDLGRWRRQFMIRAVRYLVEEAGIRQFVDVGAGLPCITNTHEVAQHYAPGARVVYVDNDPLVVMHGRALLTDAGCHVVAADLAAPRVLVEETVPLLEADRPVGVLMCGVLPHLGDDALARSVVAEVMAGMPPGSHLALSHITAVSKPELMQQVARLWNRRARPLIKLRLPRTIGRFLDGLAVVEPGLVPTCRWRQDGHVLQAGDVDEWAAVARK